MSDLSKLASQAMIQPQETLSATASREKKIVYWYTQGNCISGEKDLFDTTVSRSFGRKWP